MADVLGTVVGVISFGIRVCDGLTSYYQAWEARDDQVSSALNNISQLGKTLELLESKFKQIQITQPTFRDHIINNFSPVEENLKRLEAILKSCRIECPNGAKDRLIDFSKRVAYPFRKKTINELQILVRDLKSNLSLLLQILHL
jgi:ankyrin repeat domain-containing protein 50